MITVSSSEQFTAPPKSRLAFTLVEMLIAMAVTLILMTALATGFAFVGQSIRDGRGEVQLSNQLRDVTERLREELSSMSVAMRPNVEGEDQRGYFLYYEGPMTDATSSIFAAELADDGSVALNHSRYGDFDDYLAFTAVASGDKWFTGKVPRYILDQKTAEINGSTYVASNFAGNPWDPVVIRSKYAEIVYFVSPEYDQSTLPGTTTNQPIYLDTEGVGLPTNLRLHRRVLLIRPDLNMDSPENWNLEGGKYIADRELDGKHYMRAGDANTSPNEWLYGMAGVHQQCDLSLRRVYQIDGTPTMRVAANSLSDLAKPHNRFAHVRVPGGQIGLNSNFVTSMPALALGAPINLLVAQIGHMIPTAGPAMLPTNAGGQRLSGFLRPEFVLGQDYAHPNNPDHLWGLERVGEDVVATGVLGFDIKIYDPYAASLTTSQGLVVGPNDAGYREALLEYSSLGVASGRPSNEWDGIPIMPVMRGDFVDLCYPTLPGGAIRGRAGVRLDRLRSSVSNDLHSGTVQNLLMTPFSGFTGGTNAMDAYQLSLYRSGKVVTVGNTVRLFQPSFDTYTKAYEVDGRLQGYTFDAAQSTDYGGVGAGTRWTTVADAMRTDLGSNGIDDGGTYGADDIGERETLPPFLDSAPAIQITLRLENRDNRQLKQISVVHRDAH